MRTLSTIRTDFIQFLRHAFSDGLVKVNGQVVLRYDEDDQKTGILIKGTDISNPKVLNKTPCIMVSRGDVTPEDSTKGLQRSILSLDRKTGERHHGFVMSGPINLNCLSPVDEEAEAIGQMVFTLIEMHKPYLAKKYRHRMLNLGVLGKPRILRYEGEGTSVSVWNCPVIMQVSFHFGYRYKQVMDDVGEIDFRFLRPPIAWIEGVEKDEVENE